MGEREGRVGEKGEKEEEERSRGGGGERRRKEEKEEGEEEEGRKKSGERRSYPKYLQVVQALLGDQACQSLQEDPVHQREKISYLSLLPITIRIHSSGYIQRLP